VLCCVGAADVLTIENSRSGDEMVRALVGANYGKDVGPGVYDVHSPVVPTVEFMTEKVKTFIAAGLLKVRAESGGG
jgi:5-methyltetrahydropteroyltriglutamate--homocysteine methyltransferase